MNKYTLIYCPSLLLSSSHRDELKARLDVADQLAQLINSAEVNINLPEGFSINQFIKITEIDMMSEIDEKVIDAIKVLSKLSIDKQKVQESHQKAIESYENIQLLFADDKISAEKFKDIDASFKVLKEFAQASLRYQKSLSSAQDARKLIDKALDLEQDINKSDL